MEEDRNLSQLIDGAGPITGLVVLLVAGAMVLLWLSMNRQLKKVNPALPDGPEDRRQQADERYTEEAEERGADEQAGNDRGADEGRSA
jgi:hypothetical protein